MKIRHVLSAVGVAAVLAVGGVVYFTPARPDPPAADAPDPLHLTPADLARATGGGRYVGRAVRVPFPGRLRPTADPLVWEYRPGDTGLTPPLVRVRFAAPPQFGPGPGGVVVGTAADPETAADGRRVAVITSAAPVPR